METLTGILIVTQLAFTVIAGIYFYTSLRSQQGTKTSTRFELKKEVEQLKRMRNIQLTDPLSEKTRPKTFDEIIGQEKGIRALRAALCGPNPQHVLIYGPPGIGKTAAARIVLENAKQTPKSPFAKTAPFIEMDATILQFDERSIADPLIGSVHDPIYQGAGAFGTAGIPQPKPGAVTKAHGGVLFLDEIGELHSIQMNKLLKVLEDRKVFLNSSYYSSEDQTIPKYIHDVFENGLPADFRLVGATTRSPEDIPPALRSRCTEIFFRGLSPHEVQKIATNAFKKAGYSFDEETPSLIANYATNGRDTVNIVQTAISLASLDNRNTICKEDVEEVVEHGHYAPKSQKRVGTVPKVGVVNGLAVHGSIGALLEIEAGAEPATEKGQGRFTATGIVETEEINSRFGKMRRNGTAKNSMDNVLTTLWKLYKLNPKNYDIHVNFPGGAPVDGPSAGIAIFTAVYSAITEKEIPPHIAMTGEITIKGRVSPVGGVLAKIEAAIEAGATTVYIPKANHQACFAHLPIRLVLLERVEELIEDLFVAQSAFNEAKTDSAVMVNEVLTAKSV